MHCGVSRRWSAERLVAAGCRLPQKKVLNQVLTDESTGNCGMQWQVSNLWQVFSLKSLLLKHLMLTDVKTRVRYPTFEVR